MFFLGVEILSVQEFLNQSQSIPLLDVRSPTEYAAGHLPGAISFPLFSDAERAEVGTLYKQAGPEVAMLRGLEIVGPKMADMVRQARQICSGIPQQVAVYCWRGGKRSSSVAWLLENAGFQATTLRRGYKAFRRYILEVLQTPRKVVILGGRTGSGKTKLLQQLTLYGIQVIDLEGLAGHKGSAFGLVGSAGQPTQAQFENELGLLWSRLNPQQAVLIEDESRMIGRLPIPAPIWQLMRQAPVLYLDVPVEERLEQLLRDYGPQHKAELRKALVQIERRLGGQRTKEALAALERDDYRKAAALALEYYDRAYDYGLAKRDPASIYRLQGRAPDFPNLVQEFLNHF